MRTDGRKTDKHDEADARFRNFANAPKILRNLSIMWYYSKTCCALNIVEMPLFVFLIFKLFAWNPPHHSRFDRLMVILSLVP